MTDLLTSSQFSQRIKAKYPDYKDLDDDELTRKVLAKHPEYKSQVQAPDAKLVEVNGLMTRKAPMGVDPKEVSVTDWIEQMHGVPFESASKDYAETAKASGLSGDAAADYEQIQHRQTLLEGRRNQINKSHAGAPGAFNPFLKAGSDIARTFAAGASRAGYDASAGTLDLVGAGLQFTPMVLATRALADWKPSDLTDKGSAALRDLADLSGVAYGENKAFRESFAGQVVDTLPQVGVAMATGGHSIYGQVYSEAIRDAESQQGVKLADMSDDLQGRVKQTALAYTVVASYLERFGLKHAGFDKFLKGKISMPKNRLLALLKAGAAEGGTEAAQGQILDTLAAMIQQDGRELWSEDVFRQRWQEFAIGGVVGGVSSVGFQGLEIASAHMDKRGQIDQHVNRQMPFAADGSYNENYRPLPIYDREGRADIEILDLMRAYQVAKAEDDKDGMDAAEAKFNEVLEARDELYNPSTSLSADAKALRVFNAKLMIGLDPMRGATVTDWKFIDQNYSDEETEAHVIAATGNKELVPVALAAKHGDEVAQEEYVERTLTAPGSDPMEGVEQTSEEAAAGLPEFDTSNDTSGLPGEFYDQQEAGLDKAVTLAGIDELQEYFESFHDDAQSIERNDEQAQPFLKKVEALQIENNWSDVQRDAYIYDVVEAASSNEGRDLTGKEHLLSIFGESTVEFINGVKHYKSKIHKGADLFTVIEEEVEGFSKRYLDEGSATFQDYLDWKHAFEEETGEKTHGDDQRGVTEWLSTQGIGWYIKEMQDQDGTGKVPVSFKEYVARFIEKLRKLFRDADVIRELHERGDLNADLVSFLDRAIGLDEAYLMERIRNAESAEAAPDPATELKVILKEVGGVPRPDSDPAYRGELESYFEGIGKKWKSLKKDGGTLDGLREALQEKGFDVRTPDDVLKLLDRSSRGEEVFANTDSRSAADATADSFSVGREGIGDFSDRWTEQGVENYVYQSGDVITLVKVAIPEGKQGAGIGTAFMQDLIEHADAQGARIGLTPDTVHGGSSARRLSQFYKRFGFVENKGKHKDYEVSESMVREPRASDTFSIGLSEELQARVEKASSVEPLALELPAESEKSSARKDAAKRAKAVFKGGVVNEDTGRSVTLSGDSWRELKTYTSSAERVAVLAKIEEAVKRSIWLTGAHVDNRPSKKGFKDTGGKYHYLAMPVQFDQGIGVAFLTVQKDSNGRNLYQISEVDIKKPRRADPDNKSGDHAEAKPIAEHVTKLVQDFLEVKQAKGVIDPLSTFSVGITEEQDAAYLSAVKSGDTETAQAMVDEAAKAAGYLPHADFRDAHASPSNMGATDEDVGNEAWDASMLQVARGVHNQPSDFFDQDFYHSGNEAADESLAALSKVFNEIRKGNEGATITVYRSVPLNVKGENLENSDWVSPSRTYAVDHGDARFGEGEYRLIEEEVKASDLFWDHNQIEEWGKDDDQSRYYKNTANNIKSADPVTYDATGAPIPLSKRFNEADNRISYSIGMAEEPGTPAFKKWFGDSKIANGQGEPVVMYHGTNQDIEAFKGITWASVETSLPYEYALTKGKDGDATGANIMPVYMRIENPFDADSLSYSITARSFLAGILHQANANGKKFTKAEGERFKALRAVILESAKSEASDQKYNRYDFWNEAQKFFGEAGSEAILEVLKLAEFDGIKMVQGGETTYGAFSPEQVKSVYNRGTFDGNDPRISYDVGLMEEGDGDPMKSERKRTPEEIKLAQMLGEFRNKDLTTAERKKLSAELKIQQVKAVESRKRQRLQESNLKKYSAEIKKHTDAITKMAEDRTNLNEALKALAALESKLPPQVRGRVRGHSKLADYKTAAGRGRFLAKRIAMIDRMFSEYQASQNKRQLARRLNRFGSTYAPTLRRLSREMSKDVRDQLRVAAYAAFSGREMERPADMKQEVYENLNSIFSGVLMSGSDPQRLAIALEVSETIKKGGEAKMNKFRAIRARNSEMLGDRVADTVLDGDQLDSPSVAASKERKRSDIGKSAKKTWDFLNIGQYGFEQFMEDLDGTSEAFQGFMNTEFYEEVFTAGEDKKSMNREDLDAFNTAVFEKVFPGQDKKVAEQKLHAWRTKQESTGIKFNEGTGVIEQPLTVMQAISMYNAMKDESLSSTWEVMEVTPETREQIEEFIGHEGQAFADLLMSVYESQGAAIQAKHLETEGFAMDIVKNYGGRLYRVGVDKEATEPTDGVLSFDSKGQATVKNGSLKERMDSDKPLEFRGADEEVIKSMQEMNHYLSHAAIAKKLQVTFGRDNVRRAIIQKHGADFYKSMSSSIEAILNGGERAAQLQGILGQVRSNVAIGTLALNMPSFFKQLVSLPAYAAAMPAAEWVKYEARFWKNAVKNTKTILGTDYAKNRMSGHYDRDAADQLRRVRGLHGATLGDKFRDAQNKAMFMTRMGDIGAIAAGGWPLYQYTYDQAIENLDSPMVARGKAEAALAKASDRTQQSSEVHALGEQQRNFWMKNFTMFMTSPIQYQRNATGAIRKGVRAYVAEKNGKLSKRQRNHLIKQSAKSFAIFHVVLPVLFQAMASGFIGLWSDDEDARDDFWASIRRASLWGNVNSYFILGDIAEYAARKFSGEKVFSGAIIEAPMLSQIEDTGKSLIKVIQDGDTAALWELTKDATKLGAGIPIDPVARQIEGIKNAATGKTDAPLFRALGWSEYSLGIEDDD